MMVFRSPDELTKALERWAEAILYKPPPPIELPSIAMVEYEHDPLELAFIRLERESERRREGGG